MSPYEQLRRLIRDLNLSAQRDLEAVFRSAGGDAAALAEVLAEVVQTYGAAAATVTADWFDELRANEGIRPGFTAVIPEPESAGTTQLVNWALATGTNSDAVKSLIVGGIQRRITNYSRNVLTTSSIRDPRARGWMRVGGGSCGFCSMLISRGSVYTESSVQFKTHDDCNCTAAPAWNPNQIEKIRGEFVPSARKRSDETTQADNDRAKAWVKANL